MNKETTNQNKSKVLLLGGFGNKDIRTEIYMVNKNVDSKMLNSSLKNWDKILFEISRGIYSDIIINITESVLIIISSSEEYKARFDKILIESSKYNTMILFYQDNINGKFNIFWKHYYVKYLFYYDLHYDDKYANLALEYIISRINNFSLLYVKYYENVIIEASKRVSEKRWELLVEKYYKCINAEYRITRKMLNELTINMFVAPNKKTYEIMEFIDKFIEKYYNVSIKDKLTPNYYMSINFDELRKSINPKFALFNNDNVLYGDNKKDEYYIDIYDYEDYKEKKYDYTIYDTINKMKSIIKEIIESELEVTSFKHNIDIKNAVRTYLTNSQSKMVYKRYVYKDEFLANEFDEFLSLFQDYIYRLKKIQIYCEKSESKIGSLYVVYSKDATLTNENFNDYVTEFSEFMNIYNLGNDIEKELLSNYNITQEEAKNIVKKYNRDISRLKIDIKHEFENKRLLIKHQMENSVLLSEYDKSLLKYNNEKYRQDYDLLETSSSGIIKNIFIEEHNGPIFMGDMKYNEYDNELLDLIRNNSKESEYLIEDLKTLKDSGIDNNVKQKSLQKLKSFMSKVAPSIGKFAFNVLTKYLESKIF